MKKYVLKDKELRSFIRYLTGIDVSFYEKSAAEKDAKDKGMLDYFEVEPTDAPVRDLLSKLPHPYREKALANREKQIRDGLDESLLQYGEVPKDSSLGYILMMAFDWKETPEGREYWEDLAESYNREQEYYY